MTDLRTSVLIEDLCKLPAETSWVEFKENNTDPRMIGERISALANSARMADKPFGYMLWGIRDSDHRAVGTTFDPLNAKHENQLLPLWLSQRLTPNVAFEFRSVEFRGETLVLLEVPAALTNQVEFERRAFIRIGSATTKLSDHPDRQRVLWGKLQTQAWETGITKTFLSTSEVVALLNYDVYFELTKQRLPETQDAIVEKMAADRLVEADVGRRWNITNLGAVLFAKRLTDFSPSVARKGVRFVAYQGNSRADMVTHRQDGQKGYAAGFSGLVEYIDALLPRNEHIGKAFREAHPLYPTVAIRELVANAVIHQDMTITGAGPLVEMFSDRLEITNPGQPLVKPERFLDLPPRSRNEALASLMRRMGLCEEQGTGIDKVLTAVELHQLPAPDFRAEDDSMRVVLYAPRKYADMTPDERIRACYQHAGLKFVTGQRMKNDTLRERLGIDPHNSAQASGVIKKTIAAGLIRPADPQHPKSGYVPYWA